MKTKNCYNLECGMSVPHIHDAVEYKKGMELMDDCGDVRYVLEDQEGNEYVHLTGYDETCMCEAWYTPEELEEEQEYKPTGKTVIIEDLDQDKFIINCTCCDSE